MDRRTLLERAGVIASTVALAGCGSVAIPDGSNDRAATGESVSQGRSDAATRRPDASAGTAPARSTTEREAVDSTTQPTATARRTRTDTERTTPAPPTATPTPTTTPDPPANRLLSAGELGGQWRYASAPTERTNGTITAVYEAVDGTERLRARLWPCEGESLANLGGTCSLGNLPERYRAMETVETTTPAVGETAFAWWSGSTTDIEVVAEDHVFRLTYTATRPSGMAGDGTMAQERRLDRLVGIAHRQTRKLARIAEQ